MIPTLHILLRECIFFEIKPNRPCQPKDVVYAEIDMGGLSSDLTLRCFVLVFENNPDKIVVLIEENCQRMLQVVAVRIYILNYLDLGWAIF